MWSFFFRWVQSEREIFVLGSWSIEKSVMLFSFPDKALAIGHTS